MMKQQISALMDGELYDEEVDGVLDLLKKNQAGQKDWEMYHLIGDVLRQPGHVHADISNSFHARLESEPTVLAPYARTVRQKARVFALSAAASVLAVGVVAWMSLQISPDSAPQLAFQQQQNARPASMKIDDYLNAHQDAAGQASQEASPYMRAVVAVPQGK